MCFTCDYYYAVDHVIVMLAYGLDPGSWTRADVIEAATKVSQYEGYML
jgi:hypothetical protein